MLRDFEDVSGIDKGGNWVPRQSADEILAELAKRPAPPPVPPPLLSTAKPFESAKQFLKRQCSNRGVRTLHRIDGRFLSYTGARYEPADDETIKGRVWRFLQSARRIAEVKKIVDGKKVKVASEVPFDPKTTHVNDVFNAVVAQTQLKVDALPCWAPVKSRPAEKRCPATEIMPCKNGLLNLKTRTLLPHTPAHIGLNSLPYAYDPKAGAPRELVKFMQSIWPDDAESVQLLQEWFGYVLSGATDQQKIMLLVGATRGGKGVIARLLWALIGEANAAGPTLGSLAEPFGIEPLIGKLLATVSDGRLGKFTDGSAITERLLSISGEDSLSVQRKFMTAWRGRLPTRLMLLMNQAPALSDAAGALARRFLVLSFSESFEGREDRGLEKRLLAELPAILNWALAGLDRLNARGHFVQPAAGQQLLETVRELASPVAAFVEQRCERHEDGEVKCSDLYTAYCDWCREEAGRRPVAQNSFGAELQAAFPKIKRTRLRVGGDRAYVYDGLKLLPTPFDPSDPFAKASR
jgi:putative DNA primase/helicase